MDIYIETERLYIRPLAVADEQGMFEMGSDPEVHKYIGGKHYQTIEQGRGAITDIMQQYKDNGVGRWAVIEKATDEFVGWTGLKLMKERVNAMIDYYDFGYRLMRKFWGKGYATESGRASLSYGTDTLKLKEVYGMTDVNNAASRRVLEKLGFKYIETFGYDGQPGWRQPGEPATWYKWTREI